MICHLQLVSQHGCHAIGRDQLPLVIGRGPDVGLRLNDRWVSRRHCELLECEGQLVVRDVGARNGLFLNGTQVDQAPLQSGDQLIIGIERFRVEVE